MNQVRPMVVTCAARAKLLRPAVAFLAGAVGMGAFSPSASAQRVSLGVVTGAYAGRDFDNKNVAWLVFDPFAGFRVIPDIVQSGSGGYVVGPSLHIEVSHGVSVGIEALYKPLHYEESATFSPSGEVIGFAPATVVTWEFPILARYRFPVRRLKPFVEGGPSFRTAGNLNSSNPSHYGVSAGLGVEALWRRFRVAPVARYTRWADDPQSAWVRTRRDQIEFLVGFSYVFGN